MTDDTILDDLLNLYIGRETPPEIKPLDLGARRAELENKRKTVDTLGIKARLTDDALLSWMADYGEIFCIHNTPTHKWPELEDDDEDIAEFKHDCFDDRIEELVDLGLIRCVNRVTDEYRITQDGLALFGISFEEDSADALTLIIRKATGRWSELPFVFWFQGHRFGGRFEPKEEFVEWLTAHDIQHVFNSNSYGFTFHGFLTDAQATAMTVRWSGENIARDLTFR